MSVKKAIFGLILTLYALPAIAAGPEWVEAIPAGDGPASIVVDEGGNRVFVANARDKTVAVIEKVVEKGKEKHKIKKKIKLDARLVDTNMGANGLVYDPVTERLYLPDSDNSFLILDGKGYKHVKTVPNEKGRDGWMSAVHLDMGLREIYALDWYGFIQVYDDNGKKKREVDTGFKGVKNYAVSRDGSKMYITTGGELVEISTRGGKPFRRFALPVRSVPLIDESTGVVYVGGRGADGIGRIYKVLERDVVESDDVGFSDRMGMGMALNPNTGHLFAPSGQRHVAVLDAKSMKQIARLEACSMPRSIAVNTKTNMVYVACVTGGFVSVFKDQ